MTDSLATGTRSDDARRYDRACGRDESGTTLVDLTVGMLLAGIVLTLAYGIYTRALRPAAAALRRDDLAQTALRVQRRLADDLREATGVDRDGETLRIRTRDTTWTYAPGTDGVLLRSGRPAGGGRGMTVRVVLAPDRPGDLPVAPRGEIRLGHVTVRRATDSLRLPVAVSPRVPASAWQDPP